MDGFNYAIAAILGAMLVVISMDAYLFFMEVASRQWTSFFLASRVTSPVLVGSFLHCGNGCKKCPLISAFGSGTPTLTITFGTPNVSTVVLPCLHWPSSSSGAQPMMSNLTRFYFEFDDECRTGCFEGLAFEDVETIEADVYEIELQSKEIPYTRVDL